MTRSVSRSRFIAPVPPEMPHLPVLPRASAVPPAAVVTQRSAAAPPRASREAPHPASREAPRPAPARISQGAPKGPATVSRSAAPQTQPTPSAVRRPPASGPAVQGSGPAAPQKDIGVNIDEIVSQVTRRLRTEFRIDRERFGRLRDSNR